VTFAPQKTCKAMPHLSSKGATMPSSPIRKLMPFADKARAEGVNILHLNIGQPDIKTPQVVLDRMKNIKREVIEYSNSEGFLSYREKLSAYYRGVGIPVETSDIMVTTGGSEALTFVMMTCFDIGNEVIIPEPYYANYSGFAAMAGITVTPITTKIEDGFALPKAEAFEALISPNTKGIVLCNPGNPTGYLYSQEELEEIGKLAKKHDLYVIADEVYREFCYDGAKPFSAYNLKGLDENVILIDSVSKRYSMCGARIGALITRNKAVYAAAMKFAQARLSPPTFGQIAAEAALETPQSYFDGVISEYVVRRDVMVDGMNAIPGVYCPKPRGAFYAMAKLPIDNADKFCQWLLETFRVNNETVMLAPGSGFYITDTCGHQEVRIAYVLDKEDLERALVIIKKALEEYPGRTN
jgi:aspartate aminotransferase